MLVFSAIVPHPPLAIPEIGKGEDKKLQKTQKAFEKLASELAQAEPDVIIFITSHALIYPDQFNICGVERLTGDFSQYGYDKYTWTGKNDLELAQSFVNATEANDLKAILYDNGESKFVLDYGTMVPLYFFDKLLMENYQVLPIGYSYSTRAEHYEFGQVLAEVIKKSEKRIAVIASGDLSHRLNYDGPDGFTYEGESFDNQIIDLIVRKKDQEILEFEEDFVEDAGECGFNSILIMLGLMSEENYTPDLYSYEGPFGVGHAVINLKLEEKN